MRRSIILAILLVAGSAAAQDPGSGQPGASPAGQSSPVNDALMTKFLSCYQEEAEVTAEDKATIKQFAGDLAEGLAKAMEVGSKAAKINLKGAAAPKAAQVLDPQAIAGYSCKDLASKLEKALTSGGLDQLLGDSPAEPWAVAYTSAINEKVLECYSVEVKRAATEEEKSKLTQFNGRMAKMVSLLTNTGACSIEQSKQPACFQGIKQILCSDISTALGSDAGQLVKALSGACAGYINCGIEAAIDKELK